MNPTPIHDALLATHLRNGAPTFAPVDKPTRDKLALVADPDSPVGRSDLGVFLAACEADARDHGGIVSVNRVRAALDEADIEPHRYSSFWSHFTGKSRVMRKATTEDVADPWEICQGSPSGNDGRPYPLRVWVGAEHVADGAA